MICLGVNWLSRRLATSSSATSGQMEIVVSDRAETALYNRLNLSDLTCFCLAMMVKASSDDEILHPQFFQP